MESRARPGCLSRGKWTWRGEGLAGVSEKGGRRHGVRAQASRVLSRLPQGPFHTPQSFSMAKFSLLVPVLPSPPFLPTHTPSSSPTQSDTEDRSSSQCLNSLQNGNVYFC